jgi:hypothetical protein
VRWRWKPELLSVNVEDGPARTAMGMVVILLRAIYP